VAWQIDARARAQAWVKAVEAAAALPENQTVVAGLRKTSKNEAIFRRSWDKIKGAPSPESFGFKTEENNADKANDALGANWQSYHEYYLKRPALDRGSYLGTPTMHPAVMALGFLQLPVPSEWSSGDYVLRVRLAAASEARPEQRFLEAGMHPRNGMVRATFEVTGTMDARRSSKCRSRSLASRMIPAIALSSSGKRVPGTTTTKADANGRRP